MNLKIKKITRITAIGIFFMALFFNVKINLEGPSVGVDNAAMAQGSLEGDGVQCYSILEGTDGQSVSCSPCSLSTGIPPWYHFGDKCRPL